MVDCLAPRLRRLSVAIILGHEVLVASGFRSRLLGLAHLDRDEAGGGLFIPRCSSVHTFGMRFPLDVYFLDEAGTILDCRAEMPNGRIATCRGAAATVEIPTDSAGGRL
jgi:uncharacterized membrane protein (UPF0127 family)